MARIGYKLKRMAEERGVTEIELITKAIEEAGSVQGASRILPISPGTFHYHLAKHGKRVEIDDRPRARVVDA